MKSTTEWVLILLFCFAIGFLAHMGSNTAKKIWPTVPIEFRVTTQE